MPGYVKLFSSLVDSTIWREDSDTCKFWVTLLAKARSDGVVEASLPGLAHAASVSLSKAKEIIDLLSSPDPYSRSQEYEGRRIARVDDGWQILNYRKYRDKLGAGDRREYWREYKRAQRQSQKRGQGPLEPEEDPIGSEGPSDHSQASKAGGNGARKPQNGAPKRPRRIDCPECGKPMVLRSGRDGLFYLHPRGVSPECVATYDAEYYEVEHTEPKRRKLCEVCGEYEVENGTICEPCKAIGKRK